MQLSVSTIGSYFLKHRSVAYRFGNNPLSVSTIGSYFLKRKQIADENAKYATFSIHYWIVFLETSRDLHDAPASGNLSVSTIGSYFLKQSAGMAGRANSSLSVSTIGSYFLKHTSPWAGSCGNVSFSIHYWIVFLETVSVVRYLFQRECLSVSTIGSYFLKHWNRSPWRTGDPNFQYPLLDRIS